MSASERGYCPPQTASTAFRSLSLGLVLGVSQPAASRQIASLEAELRTRLFYRHGRGMLLTDAGRTFYQTVKPYDGKKQPKRVPLTTALPREEIRHEPDSTTCGCGCQLQRIGEDVSE
jgi:hypothetical protein